jgi:hypothetical protein
MLQCGWASVRKGGEAVLIEMFERTSARNVSRYVRTT